MTEFLSATEIEEYAARYVPIPNPRTYPLDGNLFARFVRKKSLHSSSKQEEKWRFAGYGLCVGYQLNYEAKPLGKSLWWWFLDLNVHPPHRVSFQLQPPQVVTGQFTLQGGEYEMKVTWIPETVSSSPAETGPEEEPSEAELDSKIIQFRPKSKE